MENLTMLRKRYATDEKVKCGPTSYKQITRDEQDQAQPTNIKFNFFIFRASVTIKMVSRHFIDELQQPTSKKKLSLKQVEALSRTMLI